MDIRLLVQFTDSCRRYLAAPQRLRDILYTPDRYACQIHLNESFFHTALPAAVPLDNSSFKGDPFELGYLESDIPRSGGEVAAIVPAAVALALFIALVPGCLCQFLCLSLQQFVERFLYATAHQFLNLPLDNFLI